MQTRDAVIAVLVAEESVPLAVGEIARRSEVAVPSVTRELRILVQAGAVLPDESAGEVRYRANSADPFLAELRAIALRARAIHARLTRALAGLDGIEFAFVFGPASPTGDVELMVLGNIEYLDIKDVIASAAADLGRKVNLKLHGRSHWQLKLFEGDKFMRRVAFGPKVFVVGSQEGLDRAGKAQAGTKKAGMVGLSPPRRPK